MTPVLCARLSGRVLHVGVGFCSSGNLLGLMSVQNQCKRAKVITHHSSLRIFLFFFFKSKSSGFRP